MLCQLVSFDRVSTFFTFDDFVCTDFGMVVDILSDELFLTVFASHFFLQAGRRYVHVEYLPSHLLLTEGAADTYFWADRVLVVLFLASLKFIVAKFTVHQSPWALIKMRFNLLW